MTKNNMDQETTKYFWDCECEHDYIHSKDEKVCVLCGAVAEEQPDSILSEVRYHLKNIS